MQARQQKMKEYGQNNVIVGDMVDTSRKFKFSNHKKAPVNDRWELQSVTSKSTNTFRDSDASSMHSFGTHTSTTSYSIMSSISTQMLPPGATEEQ
jgi:hypothetical protein